MRMNISTKIAKCAMAFAATLSIIAGGAEVARADFVGDYSPANWTFDPDGSTDATFTNDGVVATIVGSNDGNGATSTYTATAVSDSLVTFDWEYTELDTAQWDFGGFILNGVTETLAFNDSAVKTGTFSTSVSAGDTFGFFVTSEDGLFGAGTLAVQNFDVSAVPEPTSASILALGAIGVLARRRRKS